MEVRSLFLERYEQRFIYHKQSNDNWSIKPLYPNLPSQTSEFEALKGAVMVQRLLIGTWIIKKKKH